MKSYRNIGFGPRKGKKGFTLIELLIVMVILAILAGVVVLAVTGVFSSAKDRAYNTVKGQLEAATAQYYADFLSWPTVGGTINSSGTNVSIIDIADMMVTANGTLKAIPKTCVDVTGDDNDNCDGDAGVTCPLSTGGYIWGVDSNGLIYSICVGCGADNTDGYIDGY